MHGVKDLLSTAGRMLVSLCRWLVGLSYRVVYNRDPVPSHKAKAGLLASELVHVHGEIYIEDALVRPGGQPAPHGGACGDHDWVKYSQAGPGCWPGCGLLCLQHAASFSVACGRDWVPPAGQQRARGWAVQRRVDLAPAMATTVESWHSIWHQYHTVSLLAGAWEQLPDGAQASAGVPGRGMSQP